MKKKHIPTVKFRPWFVRERERVNAEAPLKKRNGMPFIPRHWKPKDDADQIARDLEFFRFLSYLDGRMNRFSLIW